MISGMRALLYRNLEPGFVEAAVTDVNGSGDNADRFRGLIEQVQRSPQPVVHTINWTTDAASAETFHAMPLLGRNNELLGVLLVGSSRKELVLLTRRIVTIAAVVGAVGLLVGLLVGLWGGARLTRPGGEVAGRARGGATGGGGKRVDVRRAGEIRRIGKAL